MHARLDELLSLRDGAPVEARVGAHVAECADCRAALARAESMQARLRALPPAPDPVRDGWDRVRARVAAARTGRPLAARMAPFAAAASVAALALFATLRWIEAPTPEPVAREPSAATTTDALEELLARSQALESALAALPARPAVARAGTALPIESLEAQVQWLDHQLSIAGADGRTPEAERLWRDRVEVMSSLVQLRYVEAQDVVL